MQVRELRVPDAYEFVPTRFADHRGFFVAPLQGQVFAAAVGHPLAVEQVNHSVSARGVIRGMHFADVPPGQAKYVYCSRGALLDVVVDVRVGSPSFGTWDAVRLEAAEARAVYIAEGLGHGFVALEDDTVMTYLCSTGYNPAGEHGFSPFDPALGLPWPAGLEPIMSEKDARAPTLDEARESGLLPSYADCVAYYQKLHGN
ncbi:MAG: dTDP-4-dehydrorhamnose 3,5-epimerase family protein [Sciscionella sp.]